MSCRLSPSSVWNWREMTVRGERRRQKISAYRSVLASLAPGVPGWAIRWRGSSIACFRSSITAGRTSLKYWGVLKLLRCPGGDVTTHLAVAVISRACSEEVNAGQRSQQRNKHWRGELELKLIVWMSGSTYRSIWGRWCPGRGRGWGWWCYPSSKTWPSPSPRPSWLSPVAPYQHLVWEMWSYF